MSLCRVRADHTTCPHTLPAHVPTQTTCTTHAHTLHNNNNRSLLYSAILWCTQTHCFKLTTYPQTTCTHTLHAHTDYIHTKTHAHTLPHADRLHAHTYYMPPHTTCPQTTCPHRLHAHTDTAHPHAKGSVCTRQCRLRVSACLLSQLTRGWCSRSSPHFLPTYLITLSAPLSQRLQRSAS